MKRNRQEINIPSTKRLKKLTHQDELIYEVVRWLPSSEIVSNCMLVSKQWKRVIEGMVDLEFKLDSVQWSDFSKSGTRIAHRITNLYIQTDRPCEFIKACSFRDMKRLSSLTLSGFKIDNDFIGDLRKETIVKDLSFKYIDVDCETIDNFTCGGHDMRISIAGPLPVYTPNIDESVRFLSGVDNIGALHYFILCSRQPKEPHKLDRFYSLLSKADQLSLTYSKIDHTSIKYLSNMKNLASIHICGSELNAHELPYLKESTQLKKICVSGSLCVDSSGEVKLSSLFPYLSQVTCLKLCTKLVRDEWLELAHTNNLRKLSIWGSELFDWPIPSGNLTSLDLSNCTLDNDTTHTVRSIHTLSSLYLKGTKIVSRAIEGSTESQVRFLVPEDLCSSINGNLECKLTRLTYLSVSIGPERSLSPLSTMPNLKSLALSSRDHHESKIRIEHIPKANSITALNLVDIVIEDPIHLPSIKSLRSLSITNTHFDEQLMCNVSAMQSLRSLSLSFPVTDSKAIEQISLMKGLASLSLNIRGSASCHVTMLSSMTQLRKLRLYCDSSCVYRIREEMSKMPNIVELCVE